jgi:ketosteroid isomerase-like protein
MFLLHLNRSDGVGMKALYLENCYLMQPKSDFVSGKQAFSDFLQRNINMGIKTAKLQTVEIEGQGESPKLFKA